MSMSKTLNEKVVPAVMKFVNLKGVQALKDGVLYTLPLNIIGSIFLLIACFPMASVTDFFAATFGPAWNAPLFKLQDSTMNMIAIVSVISIAYVYAKNEGEEPLAAGIISLVVFLVTTPFLNTPKADQLPQAMAGFADQKFLPIGWTGGKGMIAAIIIGICVGAFYSYLLKKDIKIKMPAGVPQGVVNAFSALIPAAIIFILADIIYILFSLGNTTAIEFIYKVIQTPLQGLSDSPGAVIVITFCIPFLWFFGVHGATVVGGMVGSLLTANTMDNAKLQAAGTLDLAHGAHVVTQQFLDNFINLSGTGQTIGLVLLMLFVGKSAQYKELGKLSVTPGCFNINEPILFGTPIVMNPIMGVPFILVPMINGLLLYAAIASGLLSPMGGLMPPWTTPPVISGFLIGGPSYALAQIVFLTIGAFMYLPFFKKADAMAYAQEKAAQQSGEGVQL